MLTAPSLTADQNAALAADADLRAGFDAILTEARRAGPGLPGACGNNPFWIWDSAGAELAVFRIFARAEYDLMLARRRAEIAAQAKVA